jgi:hypothetical protein
MSEENSSNESMSDNSNSITGSEENTENQEAVNEHAQPVSTKKKYKYKSDGQDYEEEYDDESISRQLSLAKAAQKRMNEASFTRKQAESFIHALQNDPMSVLQDPRIMGNDKFRQIAEQFLSKQLEDQLLSPEEKNQRDREAKLKKYEDQEKETTTKAEQAKLQQLEDHYSQEYQKTIMEALNTSSLPKNTFTVKRMASLMQKNLEHGLDLPAQALAQIVKEDYQRELVSLIGGADASQILSMFGEETVNKLRKHDLEKLRAGQSQPNRGQQHESRPSNNAPQKMRSDEYEAWLRKR